MRHLPLILLFACGDPETTAAPGPGDVVDPVTDHSDAQPDTDTPIETPYAPLLAQRVLVRTSLNLRGERPTTEELLAVEANPASLDGMVTSFMEDPRFFDQMVRLYDEMWMTRDDTPFVPAWIFEGYSEERLWRAYGEEPARMLARIARDDLSYRELMLADWTMADDALVDIYGLEWVAEPPAEPGEWAAARYTDGRPIAGVLATNGMWWQHGSMENNLNRGRANHILRLFLGQDMLEAEIPFTAGRGLATPEAAAEAIRTEPGCTACHDVLDPIGSHLFGFFYHSARKYLVSEVTVYHPEREREYRLHGNPPPAFLGEPSTGLSDLASHLADHPDYAASFVEHSFEALLRRRAEPWDRDILDEAEAAFRASELRIKPMLASLIGSDAYRDASSVGGRKLVSPEILASQTRGLTGYAFEIDGWDLIRAPFKGYRTLVGGRDIDMRDTRLTVPATSLLLVQQRLAEGAAGWVVARPDRPRGRQLLPMEVLDEAWVPTLEELEPLLAELNARVLSKLTSPDGPEVAELVDVWNEAYALHGSVRESWRTVIMVLMLDLDYLTY